jgi:hypothetical protein
MRVALFIKRITNLVFCLRDSKKNLLPPGQFYSRPGVIKKTKTLSEITLRRTIFLTLENLSMRLFSVSLLLFTFISSQAQLSENTSSLKAGVGYTHDFPGLNGYTAVAEFVFPLLSGFQGAIGAKRADMTGFPRTSQVQEYTRATSLDFNVYWLPLQTETSLFRIGLGYSFSFYNIKRAYPLIVEQGGSNSTKWPTTQTTGKTHGINLVAEYEYKIPATIVSIGLRGALYKAYTRTYFIGPMLGFQF